MNLSTIPEKRRCTALWYAKLVYPIKLILVPPKSGWLWKQSIVILCSSNSSWAFEATAENKRVDRRQLALMSYAVWLPLVHNTRSFCWFFEEPQWTIKCSLMLWELVQLHCCKCSRWLILKNDWNFWRYHNGYIS